MRAEFGGRMNGDGGTMGAESALEDSWLLQQQLLALEGWLRGVDLPERRSKMGDLPVEGVETAGERALRNSV